MLAFILAEFLGLFFFIWVSWPVKIISLILSRVNRCFKIYCCLYPEQDINELLYFNRPFPNSVETNTFSSIPTPNIINYVHYGMNCFQQYHSTWNEAERKWVHFNFMASEDRNIFQWNENFEAEESRKICPISFTHIYSKNPETRKKCWNFTVVI